MTPCKGWNSDSVKYIECEDGKSRLVFAKDWGIVNCCRGGVERDNCNCEIIKVENEEQERNIVFIKNNE